MAEKLGAGPTGPDPETPTEALSSRQQAVRGRAAVTAVRTSTRWTGAIEDALVAEVLSGIEYPITRGVRWHRLVTQLLAESRGTR